MNFIGWDGHTDCCSSGATPFWGENVNTPFLYSTQDEDDPNEITQPATCAGLFLTSRQDIKDDTRHGSLALVAVDYAAAHRDTKSDDGDTNKIIHVVTGVDSEEVLYEKFTSRNFEDPANASATTPSEKGKSYVGAVVQTVSSIPPKASVRCTFVFCWYFPNRPCTAPRDNLPKDIWGNRYATWFKDAKDVACQFSSVSQDLIETTRLYVETLYSSTMPWEVIESAAGRVACMRSPTIFQTKDGIVLANEGNECCPLNCTHVWGYTTLLERLFPDLAKDMRTSDFVRNFDANQGCTMRFGQGGFAIDGSLASVIKTYLAVQQSDPECSFLRAVWPNIKNQMEMILKVLDRDGTIRVSQQNTYDSAMEGANTFIGSYLVTALKATAAMGKLMGDLNYAKKCQKQAEASAEKYESVCWNDEYGYYIADVNVTNCEGSYGSGCFIDQLCATGLSTACGFGSNFHPDHEAMARRSIVRNNKVKNPPFIDQQHHFYSGDSGIRICTYPHGRLGKGMPYENLVGSGFAYPVVSGMIYDENWTDALTICKMIRRRQSGIHRSPWNEPECGLYYARSMAAWNVFDQACGFAYDSTKGSITFKPKLNKTDFSCFCTFHEGFGQYEQKGDERLSFGTVKFQVLYGSTTINTMILNTTAHVLEASLDGKSVNASINIGGIICFSDKMSIEKGSSLQLVLSSPCRDKQSKHDLMRAMRQHDWGTQWVCYIVFTLLSIGSIAWMLVLWIFDEWQESLTHLKLQ
jgi:hypothetical protein